MNAIPLRDLFAGLRRHSRTMLLFWVTIMALCAAVIWTRPSEFRSEGKLYVRLGRENVTLDPTANLGEGPMSNVPQVRESEINTIVETLKSRVIAEQVIDDLSPDEVLEDQRNWLSDVMPSKLPPREAAVAQLARMVNVAALRKSNLICVSCDACDAELAQAAAARWIDRFLNYHRALNRNPGAHSFFQEQADLLGEQLQETENRLVTLKNQAGVVELAEQKRLLLAQADELTRGLQKTETEASEAQATIAALEKQLARLPSTVMRERTSGLPNHAGDAIREQLYALELKERELSAKLTDEHFLLQQTREQLTAARDIHERQEASRSQVAESRNQAYEQVESSLRARQAEFAALAARVSARRPQLDAAQKQLATLNATEFEIARLERQCELERSAYQKYAQSLEQTRIDASLESERICNISIAEPPVVSHKHVRPNRALLMAMVAILGAFVSLGLGLALEHWGSTAVAREVEAETGIGAAMLPV